MIDVTASPAITRRAALAGVAGVVAAAFGVPGAAGQASADRLTVIAAGLDASASDLPALLAGFQRSLGVGGTVRADGFELQGDQRDKLVAELKALGYPARPAGG